MNRSGLTRGTRWCQASSPRLSSLEVINEKSDIFIFGDLSYFKADSIRLTANLRAQIDSGDPGYHLAIL